MMGGWWMRIMRTDRNAIRVLQWLQIMVRDRDSIERRRSQRILTTRENFPSWSRKLLYRTKGDGSGWVSSFLTSSLTAAAAGCGCGGVDSDGDVTWAAASPISILVRDRDTDFRLLQLCFTVGGALAAADAAAGLVLLFPGIMSLTSLLSDASVSCINTVLSSRSLPISVTCCFSPSTWILRLCRPSRFIISSELASSSWWAWNGRIVRLYCF